MTVDKTVCMGADLAGNADYNEIIKAEEIELKDVAKNPGEPLVYKASRVFEINSRKPANKGQRHSGYPCGNTV